jgi:phage tail-like protein
VAVTSDKRAYVSGKFALELDNASAGWLFSAEGGNASSDVVVEKLGPDHVQRKHIAGVKYEDIVLTFGTGMSKGLYNWIKGSFDHKYERHNGAIVGATFDHKEMSRLTFQNALIEEISFPALDASSKDAARMTLKFSPEVTRMTTTFGGGPPIHGKFPINTSVQKQWLPSNFRLRIDGLEAPCSRVNKIDALVIKQKNTENAVGELRDYVREPVYLEIPNLVITFPESHAEDFYKWHEDFVIKGNNGDDKEKNGTLEYLNPSLDKVLFVLSFKHLGIFRLTAEKSESGVETLRRVKAEMYCEEMTFDYKEAWT